MNQKDLLLFFLFFSYAFDPFLTTFRKVRLPLIFQHSIGNSNPFLKPLLSLTHTRTSISRYSKTDLFASNHTQSSAVGKTNAQTERFNGTQPQLVLAILQFTKNKKAIKTERCIKSVWLPSLLQVCCEISVITLTCVLWIPVHYWCHLGKYTAFPHLVLVGPCYGFHVCYVHVPCNALCAMFMLVLMFMLKSCVPTWSDILQEPAFKFG